LSRRQDPSEVAAFVGPAVDGRK